MIRIRCESSNVSLLHVGCPDMPLGSPGLCEMLMTLPSGNISVRPIAVDDFDNSGHPATKTASLRCSSSDADFDVRDASVNYSITNVVRPVFGEANFTQVEENTTRIVLRGGNGTFEVVTTKGGDLFLHSHASFSSPSFLSPSAALLRFASPAAADQRLILHVRKWSPTELTLTLPSFSEACGSEKICVFGLEIRNSIEPPNPNLGLAGDFSCPGLLESGERVAACFPAIVAPLSPPIVGGETRRYHAVRYVEKCAAAQGVHEDPYEEPGSPICSESIESAQKCAFGVGDTCKRCPYGAICPGGNEARSFPGFYTTSSARGIVEPCTAPAKQRCTGWDGQTLATRCGEAYAGVHQLPLSRSLARPKARAMKQILAFAGPMCEACASGFFLRPDRTCSKCPEAFGSSSTVEVLRAALSFAAGIVLTLVILALILAKLERMSGEANTRTVWMEVAPSKRVPEPNRFRIRENYDRRGCAGHLEGS
jgi:hypothetical protein